MRRLPNVPATFAFILCLFVGQSTQEAEQFSANLQGKEVVVHSNPLPRDISQIDPSKLWRHVTAREFRNGSEHPSGRR